jgi:hypothetical protein
MSGSGLDKSPPRSPVIRDMFRQTHRIEAANLKAAQALLKKGFPGGADLSGEWFIEAGSLKNAVVV